LNGGEANALLLVGADDGSLKVWRNVSGGSRESREPSLVTAWQGLVDTMASPNISTHQRSASGKVPSYVNMVYRRTEITTLPLNCC
jgi:hypothetical protein